MMIYALGLADFIVSLIVMLVTCVQLLYLESLRIRTRERASLEFFKATLESRLGLETERGSLHFTLINVGLAVIGCLTLATAYENAPGWEALAVACLLGAIYVVIGTYVVPQIVYRKSTGRGLLGSFRYCGCSRSWSGRWCGRWNLHSRCSNWAIRCHPPTTRVPTSTSKR